MLILSSLILTTQWLRSRFGLRESFVVALLLQAGLATVSTVILSLFSTLTHGAVQAWWLLVNLAVACLAIRARPMAGNPLTSSSPQPREARGPDWELRLAWSWTLLLVLGTGLLALLSVPRIYDVLVYHMPRVLFWVSNQSVHFYPTAETRQNFVSPFAGYLQAHLLLLHGSDRLALFVQWFAYLGTLVTSTLLADELGGDKRTRILTLAVTATLPIAVLQAPTALTDLVNGLWLSVFVWAVLRYRRSSNGGPVSACILGGSLGLAILSKATSYFFALPFGLWWLVLVWRRRHLRRLVLATMVFLSLNGYHYAQSTYYFGSPISTGRHTSFLNDNLGPRTALASTLKHLLVDVTLPVTQKPALTWADAVNRASETAVTRAVEVLGIDPDRNNIPQSAKFGVSLVSDLPQVANSPQSTSNILHFAFFLLATLGYFLGRKARQPQVTLYWLAMAAGFLIFTSCFKWQPWIGRFHTSFFLLSTPFIALHWTRAWRRAGARIASLAVLAVYALAMLGLHLEHDPFLVLSRPRDELYLKSELVAEIADAVGERSPVGLLTSAGKVEYAFLHFLVDRNPGVEIGHAYAQLGEGQRQRLSRQDYEAIVVITQYGEPPAARLARANDDGYREVFGNAMGLVLVRETGDGPPPTPPSD